MARRTHVILGVHITDRVKRAGRVQQVLTKHGGRIKTRLGLHEEEESGCAPSGLILLEIVGSSRDLTSLQADLRSIAGVDVKKMVFPH